MGHAMFVLLSVAAVAFAAGVVASRNAVNAAMCLLMSLLSVAGLFARLDAYLLAFLLLLVYAGAVVALFLFIVMLLDVKGAEASTRKVAGRFSAWAALVLAVAGLVSFALKGRLVAPAFSQTSPIGAPLKRYAAELFTTYLLPVEVVGLLLLAAMLGVVVLSQRDPKP